MWRTEGERAHLQGSLHYTHSLTRSLTNTLTQSVSRITAAVITLHLFDHEIGAFVRTRHF